ncbi:hypothetical protein [Sneathia sanguinegens]|uniref:hypothetical protein n=1 Tax=Sneathia sanguinegens TaxID=40543 RepID=UPI002584D859|nr:hypothetical protein [Sneathia sanguinegens]MDU4652906.1 hypothetical protein [Sneathia sanguinegens]
MKINKDKIIKILCIILAAVVIIYIKKDPEIKNMPIGEDYITDRGFVGLISLISLGVLFFKETRKKILII